MIKVIGRDSYGEVWLARNVLGEYRAVKVICRRAFDHDRPYEREAEGIRKSPAGGSATNRTGAPGTPPASCRSTQPTLPDRTSQPRGHQTPGGPASIPDF